MYQDILFTVENRIATITLNRPEFRNAFSEELSFREIRDALEKSGEDDNVSVVVITGTGAHFCAGGDIKNFKRLIDEETYLKETPVFLAGETTRAVRKCPKPVIAMINGTAAGAGAALACACDFRIMTQSSKIVMAFINMALPGDTGALYYLERLVGLARATELMMTGDPLGGTEAFARGACNRLAEEGGLAEETYKFARKLGERPLYAIAKQKEIINEFYYKDSDKFIFWETQSMVDSARQPDFKEAVYAFLEKRKPQFNKK